MWCSRDLEHESLADVRWVAIDLETSGLIAARDRVLEAAAYSSECGTGPSLVAAWRDEGGTGDQLSAGLERIAAALDGNAVLVAHNLAFDLGFLAMVPQAPRALVRPSRWVCTLELLAQPVALDVLAALLGVAVEGRHTADGDARALCEVVTALAGRARAAGNESVGGLADALPGYRGKQRPNPASVVPGWRAVRQALDHVVPAPSVSKEQRSAFAGILRTLADPLLGPADPLAHDAVVTTLRGAGVTASGFDILNAEWT